MSEISRFARWNFEGECALVSGGARGIGAAIVRRLADSGARVVFGDIDETGGREIAAELNGKARFVHSDFSEPEAWPRLLREAAEMEWEPNLVVSNVGINQRDQIERTSLETYDRMTLTNQRSMWLAARDTVAALKFRPRASLIFTGSVMSRLGANNGSIYAMTKASLSGLVRALCVELAPHGIRVNAILPGYIQINPPHFYRGFIPRRLWDEFFESFRNYFTEWASDMQPLAIAGSPEDIAQAVCFLHSDSARFISGTELVVDGGLLCQSPLPPGKGNDSNRCTPEMTAWLHRHGVGLPPPG